MAKEFNKETLRNEVLTMLVERRNLKTILDFLSSKLEAFIPGAICSVQAYNADDNRLYHAGGGGHLPPHYLKAIEGIEIGPEVGSCGTAAYYKKRVISEDITKDSRWDCVRDLIEECQLKSCWSEPIMGSGEGLLGTFAIYHQEVTRPQAEEIHLIESIALISSLALSQGKIELEKQHIERIQQSLFQMASGYINIEPEEIDRAINQGLSQLGELFKVDRSYLFLFDYKNRQLSNTNEWCAEGIEAQIDNLQNLPFEEYESWLQLHFNGETLVVKDVSTLEYPEVREILESQSIKSLVTVPLRHKGRSLGFLGFDSVREYRHFSKDEINLLQFFSEILVNLLQNNKRENQLRDQNYLLQSTGRIAKVGGWQYDSPHNELKLTAISRDILGFNKNKRYGLKDWEDLIEGDDYKETFKNLIEKCLKAGTVVSNKFPLKTPAGLVQRWIQIRGDQYSENNKLMGIRGSVQDITEDQYIENLQKAQHKLAQATINSSCTKQFIEKLNNELQVFGNIKNFVVGLYDKEKDLFYAPYQADEKDDIPEWPAGKSLSGLVKETKETVILDKAEVKQYLKSRKIEQVGTIPETWVGIPVMSDSEFLGLMIIQNYQSKHSYSDKTIKGLEIFARQLGVFIKQQKVEELLRLRSAVIEQSPLSIFIFDKNRIIQYANPYSARLAGIAQHDIPGQSIEEVFLQNLSSWQYEDLTDNLNKGKEWRDEMSGFSQDGVRFWLDISIAPIFNAQGEVTHFAGITKDITEERRLSKELRDNLEQIRVINNNTPTIIWKLEIDAQGKVVDSYFSSTVDQLLGLPHGTINNSSQRHLALIEKEYQPLVQQRLARLASKVGSISTVDYPVNKEGQRSWFQSTARSVQQGNSVIIYGSTIDITHRKQQEEALINNKNELKRLLNQTTIQNQRLRDYAFIVSHNIRNSVANLMGLSDLLMDDPGNKEYTELMRSSVKTLDGTIRNLNELITFENMVETQKKVPCPIREILERILKMRSHIITQKQADVHIEDNDKLSALAIPAFFESIFDNLISNALKYGVDENNKRIDISVRENQGYAEISISDYGSGIDLEKHGAKIFNAGSRFHQLSSEGRGLGLFLTKNQIESLEGDIDVKSEPGKGATFTVYLLLASHKKEAGEEPQTAVEL